MLRQALDVSRRQLWDLQDKLRDVGENGVSRQEGKDKTLSYVLLNIQLFLGILSINLIKTLFSS